MTAEFNQEYWESTWENISLPQEIRPEDIPEIHRILCSILPLKRLSFIEIGCAPGKWMAYFAKQFNCIVQVSIMLRGPAKQRA
jgi:tRNA G46 methylase TrmB